MYWESFITVEFCEVKIEILSFKMKKLETKYSLENWSSITGSNYSVSKTMASCLGKLKIMY